METTRTPERLAYRLSEAAAAIGASTTTVRRWIKEGDLAVVRRGRYVAVLRADLEALLKADWVRFL